MYLYTFTRLGKLFSRFSCLYNFTNDFILLGIFYCSVIAVQVLYSLHTVVSCYPLTFPLSCACVVSVGPEPGSDQRPPSPAGGGPQGEAGYSGKGKWWLSALSLAVI